MLKLTFQTHCLFLGEKRKPGDVLDPELLQKALIDGRTTMAAIQAMKNRNLAIIQDDEAPNAATGDSDRLDRIERNMALIAKALGVELEAAPEQPSAKRGRKKSAA